MLANTDRWLFFFILTCLGVWRMSSLLAREEGPLKIFNRIRVIAGKFKPLYSGVICMWCNSLWFSAIAAILFARNGIEWFILFVSISAIAILIESLWAFLDGRRK